MEAEGSAPAEGKATAAEPSGEGERPAKASEKFFIVKSLTVEDLELSVRNGIWATQAHNEAALNKAFEVRTRGDSDLIIGAELIRCSLLRTST